MGATKEQIFTEEQIAMAQYAKAMAHPARIAILQELLQTKSCVCGSLVETIGLAQATISQHLKELKQSGLIKGDIEGTSVCYCIHEENWNKIGKEFQDIFNQYSTSCC